MADKIKQTVRLKGRAYTAGMEAQLAEAATPEEIKSMKDRNLISGKFTKPESPKNGETTLTTTAAISDATPPGVGDAERAAEKASKSSKTETPAPTEGTAGTTGGTAGTGDAGKTGETGKTA